MSTKTNNNLKQNKMETLNNQIEKMLKNAHSFINNAEKNTITLNCFTPNERTLEGLTLTKKELNKQEKNGTILSWWPKCELIQIEIETEKLNNWTGAEWENWAACQKWHLEEL